MSQTSQTAKKLESIFDLTPDSQNANRHSQRGMSMMETSLTECGFGDSLTVDKNGNVISGNGRLETLAAIDMAEAIIVQSDGTRPIVHQRTDLDLTTDVKAKRLAVLQNRVGETNLNWDAENLALLAEQGVGMDDLFSADEMTALLADYNYNPDGGADETEKDKYSPEIGSVVYEPKETNHKPKDLFDSEIANSFEAEIKTIADKDIQKMLLARAAIFTKFNYSRIADYYAYQASEEEKVIFEKLSLVLLDLGQLIQNGFSENVTEVQEENGFNDD